MVGYNLPSQFLGWLGRQGTRAVAATILVGIAVPPLGAALRPFLPEAVFALLCIAFMRVDPGELRRHLTRPWPVLAATCWTALVVPALFGVVGMAAGLDQIHPGLYLGLMLQGVASPMMAAPAFAALMGFDVTFVLLTLVTSSVAVPLTASFYAGVFVDGQVALSPVMLGLKLSFILFGSMAIGLALRRVAGEERIRCRSDEIDGTNVLILFVFVAAVLSDVSEQFLAAPIRMLSYLAIATFSFAVTLWVTTLAFFWLGRRESISAGFLTAQRNMGLMFAATGGAVPDLTWLYFACYQFPVYLSPAVLKWLLRRHGGG